MSQAYHYELLNEIHAQKAGRDVVGEHHFSKTELDRISLSVGDGTALGKLNWDKDKQPTLVAATILEMERLYPYIAE